MKNQMQQYTTRTRGSIMLAVVVLLVLLALLGTAYIQQARYDRIASVAGVDNNIKVVAQSAVAYISDVLKNDLLNDAKDTIFDATENKDEPYDYAWTNTNTYKVTDSSGAEMPDDAEGGTLDDTWLASSEPIFNHLSYTAGTPVWEHITNLNGIFLRLPLTVAGKPTSPDELPVNNTLATDQWRRDSIVPIMGGSLNTYLDAGGADPDYQDIGADADADGIPDSKWTWAPIRQISGVSYVMAVRIIDNASMINVNVATSLVDAGNSFDTTASLRYMPTWYSPAELNFGRFYLMTHQGTTADTSQLLALLQYRLGAGLASVLVPDYNGTAPSPGRLDFWEYGAKMYNNYHANYKSLGMADEMFLRHRNGLNSTAISSTLTDSTNGIPTVMRSASNETTYSDISGVTADAAGVKLFFENEPRHQMTVRSGSAVYGANMPLETGFKYKTDINKLIQIPSTGAAGIASVITRIYSYGDMPTLPPHTATVADFADQAAASIIDYADTDNYLTTVGNYTGMEQLPVITEVNVQRAYTITTTTDHGADGDPNTWTADATSSTADIGYAIEIRNPFPYAIKLENVYLRVGSTAIENGTPGNDLKALAGTDYLKADQALVLYHSAGAGTGDDDMTALIDGTVVSPVRIIIPVTDTWPNAPVASTTEEAITVTLHAADSVTHTQLSWPYQSVDSLTWPASHTGVNWTDVWHGADPKDPPAGKIYWQYSTIGRGDKGLSMLAMKDSQFRNYFNQPTSPAALHRSKMDRLGTADKSVSEPETIATYSFTDTPGATDVVNITTQQLNFGSQGYLTRVGELAKVCFLGPSSTRTFADQWDATTGSNATLDNFRLDLSNTARVSGTSNTDNLAIPHAQLLMDQFINYSPRNDGLDNDPQVADAQELFVPGTINLNTASSNLLYKVLPIPDDATVLPLMVNKVINEIVAYRDKTGTYATITNRGNRINPGIAYIGELFGMTQSAGIANGTQHLGGDGLDNNAINNGASSDVVIDTRFDLETGPSGDNIQNVDSIVDDREEKAMIASWLMGVCSTRSDIFTAYIYIRGYSSSDFTKGPIESKRMIAVFDRSNIVDGASTPKVIGMYEY